MTTNQLKPNAQRHSSEKLFVKITTLSMTDHVDTPYEAELDAAFRNKSYTLEDSDLWVQRDKEDPTNILGVHVPLDQEELFIDAIKKAINDTANTWVIGDICETCMFLSMPDTLHGEEINVGLSLDVVDANGTQIGN